MTMTWLQSLGLLPSALLPTGKSPLCHELPEAILWPCSSEALATQKSAASLGRASSPQRQASTSGPISCDSEEGVPGPAGYSAGRWTGKITFWHLLKNQDVRKTEPTFLPATRKGAPLLYIAVCCMSIIYINCLVLADVWVWEILNSHQI